MKTELWREVGGRTAHFFRPSGIKKKLGLDCFLLILKVTKSRNYTDVASSFNQHSLALKYLSNHFSSIEVYSEGVVKVTSVALQSG